MNAICGDNRFEIIAKVKEHLLKATNIEMQPEELKQVDNILFRLWQLGYFDSVEKISKLEEQIEDWKSDHEYSLRLMKGLNEKIAELETKISILLSCKNCPENKGGLLCQKEYEDKCLSQKIQYIKELKEENKKWKDEWQEQVQKENDESYARTLQTIQLNKAKKIISNLYAICKDNHYPNTSVLMEQAEQFLKECE